MVVCSRVSNAYRVRSNGIKLYINANLIAVGPLVMYLVVDLNVNIRVCLTHVLLFYVSLNQLCMHRYKCSLDHVKVQSYETCNDPSYTQG